jgi:hypothetical protein
MAVGTIVKRLGIWLRRYGPPELLGTVAALVGASLAQQMSSSEMAAAVTANWTEAIAYYGLIIIRDLWADGRSSPHAALTIIRSLVIEFGPAELLNLTLIRNATLYAGITMASSLAMGVIAGKIVADILFYLMAVASYELLRRRWGHVEHMTRS